MLSMYFLVTNSGSMNHSRPKSIVPFRNSCWTMVKLWQENSLQFCMKTDQLKIKCPTRAAKTWKHETEIWQNDTLDQNRQLCSKILVGTFSKRQSHDWGRTKLNNQKCQNLAVKVSWFRNVLLVSLFWPKYQQNIFCISL